MADSGTLSTTAQVLLAIGKEASADQILEANTNIWILYAESEMETEAGQNVEIVSNYASITASMKQWLASVAANRAAWHGINQDQNNWKLSTTQSKLNVLNASWEDFKKKIKDKDVIADLGL